MKKLGILTFNRALNYGAILQAYAMKQVCEKLGYEAHVIDYNKGADSGPQPVRGFLRSPDKKRALIRLVKGILSYRWDQKRWKAFRRFRRQYLSESKTCKNALQVTGLKYDAYVLGSDQIWNYGITGGTFNPVYFGRLPKKEGAVTVVYGASAHDTPFPLNMELMLQSQLSKTDAPIGIREQKLADYVGKLTGIKYPVVLDPVLLAGKEVLKQVESRRSPETPYILLYQIDHNPASDISIASLEKRFGCRVYSMTVPKLGSSRGKKGYLGPEDFLALLDHAEFLVTNSFHGVALSLLWHKQFYVYENGGVMTRIDGLLGSVGLNNRKVRLVSDIDLDSKIDYTQVDPQLEKMRKDSCDFLQKALQGDRQVSKYVMSEERSFARMADRSKKDCSGCSACVEICPVKAIEMKADHEGFLYPEIDQNLCIHCGACDRFCSFRSLPARRRDDLPEAYGAKHKKIVTRETSRSGGAFIAISDTILNKGGVVYGAVLDESGKVFHMRAETPKMRDRMKGAKYVQSDMRGILKQAEEDLCSGRKVLFSGTPCQVAGLKELLAFKKINSDNLLTCDLVCHGVPSPAIWADYCSYIQKKYHARIVKADFRDKSFGWDTHCESFVMNNGKKIVSRDYTDLFYDHIMFRPSCHNCKFSNINRVGDITLADFWGVEKSDPTFGDAKGVSLLLINTEKGKQAFTEACSDLEWIKCDIRNCIQPTLVKPSEASPRREMFWESYQKRGFSATLNEYVKPVQTSRRIKRDIKQLMYRIGLRRHP